MLTSQKRPHDIGSFLFFKDIKRCPFVWGSPEMVEWCKKDDERLEALAISRGWKKPADTPTKKEETNGEEKG